MRRISLGILKPFYRITRPVSSCNHKYILDSRYANDRSMLCRAYILIEDDLKELFEFVEPADANLATYSHRIYELFLRSSTEFETNCKAILYANGYTTKGMLNIKDYHKIDTITKLSEYEIYINIWGSNRKLFQPFKDWKNGYILNWYQNYNLVKHDRNINFHFASMENLLNAVAGLYAILFAQFNFYALGPYQETEMLCSNDNNEIYLSDSLFSIKPPIWNDSDHYDFDWDAIKNQNDPFSMVAF